ncbi:MAG TPA: hypothetical protein VFJ16_28210 [Longimicrobium sp.]|nr:hypothetical protein [Longimicrobium sp.]
MESPRGKTAGAASACRADAGDSAFAVCLATRPASHGIPGEAFEVVRRGDTICVTTIPAERAGMVMLDGTIRTKVVRGVVVERVESDSIGCG